MISQSAVLAAYEKHNNKTLAAAELGIPRTTFRRLLKKVAKKESALTAPEGYRITSARLAPDGTAATRWIKPLEDKTHIRDAVIQGLVDALPKYDVITPPATTDADLISVYVITDYHFGMMAWHEETGSEDWDVKKAEQLLVQWFKTAIDHAPASEHAAFVNLGDYLHWDGLNAVTPEHGNLLDADTRFAKLVRVVIRVTRQIINMLLVKHQRVSVVMADDNHSPASEIWMREWLASLYEDNPRIHIEQSADSYYCIEHGQTSLFFHHGHKRKVASVDDVFVAKFREVFGRTKHSYAHLGHLHSNELRETNLMQVERHRTLCAPDAYASKGGWISGRDAKVITYSKRFGEVHRMTINPDMVRCSA